MDWSSERPLNACLQIALAAVGGLLLLLVLFVAYAPRAEAACAPTVENALCRGNFNPDAHISTDRVIRLSQNGK